MANYEYLRPEVSNSLPLWKTIDDLSDGYIGIVQNNPKKYLPQSPKESDEAYQTRLKKATFINPYNDTIEGMTGLVFKEPIVYEDDIPSVLQPMIENATMTGEHMDLVIQDLFTTALNKGIAYGLVDMPSGQATNRAEEQAQGIRPYITIIQPENLTSWKTATRNGQTVLTQIKILELVEQNTQDTEFETEMVKQYRIYTVDENFTNTRLQVIQPENNLTVLDINTNLNFIPLVGLNLNKRGFFYAYPPFYDVAQLNISHYQLFTDARYAAHKASVPFYTACGAQKEEVEGLVISPNTFVVLGNPDAEIKIVDYDGKGAEVSMNLMNKVESSIAQMGLNMLTADRNITATEAEIDNTKSQSKLNTYVLHLEDAVELLLLYAYRMFGDANAESGGSISINADIINNPLTPEEMTKYSDMVLRGQITLQSMWKILKDGGRLYDDFDSETEESNLETEGLLSDSQPNG